MVNYSKIINISILITQVVLFILAFEIGGWFLYIYIVVMMLWGAWWSYKNWFTIRMIADYILSSTLKQDFHNGKVIEVEKKRKRK